MQQDIVLRKLNFDPLGHGEGGVCGQNICYMYHVATFCDPIKFDMQQDHVLKKLGGGGLPAKHLLPCCCILDSL